MLKCLDVLKCHVQWLRLLPLQGALVWFLVGVPCRTEWPK